MNTNVYLGFIATGHGLSRRKVKPAEKAKEESLAIITANDQAEMYGKNLQYVCDTEIKVVSLQQRKKWN